MTNLYKILPIGALKSDWWGQFIVERDLANCRKNNAGTKVIIKLLKGFQKESNVPQKFKADFRSNKSYLTHAKALVEMRKAEWRTLE